MLPTPKLLVRSVLFAVLASGVFLGAGCIRNRTVTTSAAPTHREFREYLRLAFALGQRDPDSIDYYYGPATLVADLKNNPPSLSQIQRSAVELSREIQSQPSTDIQERSRQDFLLLQLRAIVARIDLLQGARPPFDRETEELFGIKAPAAVDQSRLRGIREELNRLLPGTGELARRYAAFESGYLIPPAKLPSVMDRAIQGCRAETLKHIDLPPNEGVRVEYVANQPWSGFSRYEGNFRSVIKINTDFPLTVDRALQLACHEGYPGHHVYNSIRELLLVRGQHMAEYMIQPTFSPQSLKSEAAATFAVELAFPASGSSSERAAFEGNVLFPLAGLDPAKAERYVRIEKLVDDLHTAEPGIARDYLDGRLEFERAGAELEKQTLMAFPESALKYINEYRSYMAAYTVGVDLVQELVDANAGLSQNDGRRWRRYFELMTSMAPLPALDQRSAGTTASSAPAESLLASSLGAAGGSAALSRRESAAGVTRRGGAASEELAREETR